MQLIPMIFVCAHEHLLLWTLPCLIWYKMCVYFRFIKQPMSFHKTYSLTSQATNMECGNVHSSPQQDKAKWFTSYWRHPKTITTMPRFTPASGLLILWRRVMFFFLYLCVFGMPCRWSDSLGHVLLISLVSIQMICP